MSTQVPPSRLDSTKDFSSLVPSAFARANAAFITANNEVGGFAKANAAYASQNTTAAFADAAFVHANAAYASANTATTTSTSAFNPFLLSGM